MKFKGKKAIMAAALSAIVAASSLSTISVADDSDDDLHYIVVGEVYEYGATGTVDHDWYVHSGEKATVIATPGPNSYISKFHVYIRNLRDGTEALWYKYDTITFEPIKYELEMPHDPVDLDVYVEFGYKAAPEPAEPTTPVTPTPTPTWKRGDVNLDGYVNVADATLVLKHVAGLEKLTGQKLINADVNGDGKVTAADATAILKLLVNKL